ncbi:MAG: hypothetical protein MZV64_17510 [Ignavibacteriales bacterium]|nr:hypothetical protein [Ignavibacteriales bacterium]
MAVYQEMREHIVQEAHMNLQTCHIMLVEDENIIAMDVQQRLEMLGYQVVAQGRIRRGCGAYCGRNKA